MEDVIKKYILRFLMTPYLNLFISIFCSFFAQLDNSNIWIHKPTF